MLHIRKQKTFNGEMKYAVVKEHVSKVFDGREVITRKELLPVDYTVTYKGIKENRPAIFNLDSEGLEEAKQVQKIYKNK